MVYLVTDARDALLRDFMLFAQSGKVCLNFCMSLVRVLPKSNFAFRTTLVLSPFSALAFRVTNMVDGVGESAVSSGAVWI